MKISLKIMNGRLILGVNLFRVECQHYVMEFILSKLFVKEFSRITTNVYNLIDIT